MSKEVSQLLGFYHLSFSSKLGRKLRFLKPQTRDTLAISTFHCCLQQKNAIKMPGIIEKTKDAVSNAAEAVKDKMADLTGMSHEDRAKDSARSAWEETKDKAYDKKEDLKDWAHDKAREADRKMDRY
ncbi:unnamed protein product, partial [Mesorhabditis spiculigera]